MAQGAEMLTIAGCKNIGSHDTNQAPGLDIHEMGGVRMGKDPKTSLLNKWNQMHQCPNVLLQMAHVWFQQVHKILPSPLWQ